MEALDWLNATNADYLEDLYERYQRDPRSLDAQWRAFFAGFELGYGPAAPALRATDGGGGVPPEEFGKGAYALVNAYRALGHYVAKLDPLGHSRDSHPLLEIEEYGFSPDDLGRHVGTGGFLGPTDGTLRDLLDKLRLTYCRSLGIEYMEIADKEQRSWLQHEIEPQLNRPALAAALRRQVLLRLVVSEEFERYLHTRYIGHKRFSLEGAEALLPLLDTVVEEGARHGVEEIVMGMAHRGRLNVLAHVVRKPYEIILSEFEETFVPQEGEGDGDVKYHLGYSRDHSTANGRTVHLSLSANPSHLELVNPVIEGIVYAKQAYLNDAERRRVVPLLIHGEAAFTGQGIVPETLGLSQLQGYCTGGTIHIILNNQIGFTATPEQLRCTLYPTDVAKTIQAPILHVNADDPEAVVQAARLAIGFRQQFKRDVMIDLYCYRRYGHNETDDPTFTQPLMYREIDAHPTVSAIYLQRLMDAGVITADEVEQTKRELRQRLDAAREVARQLRPRQRMSTLRGVWTGLTRPGNDWRAQTAVAIDMLRQVGEGATRVPSGFSLHPKLTRWLEARREMIDGKRPIDWSYAETLALGSLLLEKIPVRLTGQDSERGTFSQRHAVWHDVKTGERYVPLAHLAQDQAPFVILNTMLSELAVLGFEYGVSSADPRRLVLWEAQFGDFANGAQPIIDQFIASAESKWQRMSGLVLLLPHGYEGQGPEHSSARLERFLQLCAEQNLQVCYPTTPAQYFHVLRRQMHRAFRKPLILMTPKSLLRHERCVSALEEFTAGSFRLVLDDATVAASEVHRLLLCSGKIYFDLLAAREKQGLDGIAIVRVEELYPFPAAELQEVFSRYPQVEELVWVQEEPHNMGAWSFIAPRLHEILPEPWGLSYCGRHEAATPATGLHRAHVREQQAIIDQALGLVQMELGPTAPQGQDGRRPAGRERSDGDQR
ncbi:MAG TPA: 2-oxoglutarate dehydrogenase E1 component [Alphaproteobacteria bacterium]|nr:2-oxoglutarate dehydrogenase E1 component [Alphaproteobacteria bacterium]